MSNVKAEVKVTTSANTDFSDPDWVSNFAADTATPSQAINLLVSAATGGTTLNTTHFLTTLKGFIVQNTDSTNYVDAGWTDVGSNANVQRVAAGEFLYVTGLDRSVQPTITANTAAVVCKVVAWGT